MEFISETLDFDKIWVEEKESKDNFSFSIAKFKKGLRERERDPFCADSMTAWEFYESRVAPKSLPS